MNSIKGNQDTSMGGLAKSLYQRTLEESKKQLSTTLTHSVEHAGYGAILSRLMTGFNRSLSRGANYYFEIDSPYDIESLFDIKVKQSPENLKNNRKISWDFFKDTWDASAKIRRNHQFPECPIKDGKKLTRHQWCAVLAHAICGNPSLELKAIITSIKERLKWEDYDIRVGLHVRRGDKNTESPYIPTETYIHFFEQIHQKYIGKKIAIYLSSDDPNCLSEFQGKLKDIPILWDAEEDRFNNYNAQMVKENKDLAKQESITAAKNISLLGDCDYVIGMSSAQFTWLGGLLCIFKSDLDESRHIMIDPITKKRGHWAISYGFLLEDIIPISKDEKKIKVLHISPDIDGGGAAKAAYRIHSALMNEKIDSKMLVLKKSLKDPSISSINGSIIQRMRNKIYKYLNKNLNKKTLEFSSTNQTLHSFGDDGYNLSELLNRSDADIIHLHWITGMLSIEDIGKITKPIVWTLHDMWPFCGGEHYVPDDNALSRFRAGYLKSNRPNYESGPDFNRLSWNTKMKAWKDKKFSIVGTSRWLVRCACESLIFKSNAQFFKIPLPIDSTLIWKPYSRAESREYFALPINKKIILAGAVGGVNNFYKGGDLLKTALSNLEGFSASDVEIVLFGQDPAKEFNDWKFCVRNIGFIDNPESLAKLYSCADVVVVPSRQEAFGQVASEAQSCGTPVAAFNIGGLADIVAHQETGWLATPYDTLDLAQGIQWLLENPQNITFSENSRNRAKALFSEQAISQQYLDAYQKTLKSVQLNS